MRTYPARCKDLDGENPGSNGRTVPRPHGSAFAGQRPERGGKNALTARRHGFSDLFSALLSGSGRRARLSTALVGGYGTFFHRFPHPAYCGSYPRSFLQILRPDGFQPRHPGKGTVLFSGGQHKRAHRPARSGRTSARGRISGCGQRAAHHFQFEGSAARPGRQPDRGRRSDHQGRHRRGAGAGADSGHPRAPDDGQDAQLALEAKNAGIQGIVVAGEVLSRKVES